MVPPKTSDGFGYGIRVPGLMISKWAKRNFVDRQILSFDAYLKFIKDLFCDGERINAGDNRPTVREDSPFLGDLLFEFDFDQSIRSPDAFLADMECPFQNN